MVHLSRGAPDEQAFRLFAHVVIILKGVCYLGMLEVAWRINVEEFSEKCMAALLKRPTA